MPGLNGHSNGHSVNGHAGGQGVAALIDPHHKRASLRVIQRAVERGWKIPDEWYDTLPGVALKIAASADSNPRDRLRALEVLRGMASDSVTAAIALDKIERLDTGGVTERHEHLLPPDARARVNRLTELLGNADDR